MFHFGWVLTCGLRNTSLPTKTSFIVVPEVISSLSHHQGCSVDPSLL